MRQNRIRHINIILFLSVILLLEIFSYINKKYAIFIFDVKATTEAEIKDELIVASFIRNITADCNTFYNNYFSTELDIYNYEVKVKDVSKQVGPPYIYVTFGITPMYGAHNPVGYDEATYKTDVFGEVSLVEFQYIKSYEIPERYQEIIIKPLPKTD